MECRCWCSESKGLSERLFRENTASSLYECMHNMSVNAVVKQLFKLTGPNWSGYLLGIRYFGQLFGLSRLCLGPGLLRHPLHLGSGRRRWAKCSDESSCFKQGLDFNCPLYWWVAFPPLSLMCFINHAVCQVDAGYSCETVRYIPNWIMFSICMWNGHARMWYAVVI